MTSYLTFILKLFETQLLLYSEGFTEQLELYRSDHEARVQISSWSICQKGDIKRLGRR